jgi:hypothetical protein
MADRVDHLLGRAVLRLCGLNDYLSSLGEQSLALAKIDAPGAGALPHYVKQHDQ